jgi:orotate phosphoribosyltransferase
MSGVDGIAKKALELKERGMNDKEIARELHLSENTVVWLMTRGVKSKAPPATDVKIGWTSIGVYGHRISYLANILSDIIMEECATGEFEVETVVGVAINGIPLATHISDELGLEFSVYRPPQSKDGPGALSSNFANVDGKAIVIVDDVIGTGETMRTAVKDLSQLGAKPKLLLGLVNKTDLRDMDGIPLRSLVRARSIG